MSSGSTPFHESGGQFNREGASDECLYNDHNLCRSNRCGCSCHRQRRVEADNAAVSHVRASDNTGPIKTRLDKYCPQCKTRYDEEVNFCVKDGSKLSSLKCPNCGTPGGQDDNYCGYCGCSMKADDRELERAATGMTGSGITEDSAEISASSDDAEAAMRASLGQVAKVSGPKRIPAPVSPVISSRMFK